VLIGLAYDLEKQFGSSLREGNIAQFINDQQIESLELFLESLQSSLLAALHELSDKIGGCMEAHFSALAQAEKARADAR